MPERYYIEHSLYFEDTWHIFDRYPVLGEAWIEVHCSLEEVQKRCDELNIKWRAQMNTCPLKMVVGL